MAPGLKTALRLAAAPVRAWDRFFFAEIDARRLAALRIGVGVLSFLTLAGLAPEAELFYSDAGWLPVPQLLHARGDRGWTLLYLFTSPLGVKVFLGLSMAAALLMAVGLFSRAASFATFVALVSFQQRNTFLVYGGDVVLRLLALGVALGPAGRALSLDALRARFDALATRGDRGEHDIEALGREAAPRATMPAWPIRLLQFQIALIYFMSGLAKLHGSSWWDGSAIASALSVPPIERFDLTSFLASAPGAVRVMALATMFWEISFPLLVCSRRGRWIALGGGVALHLGIIVFMRIHWFGHVMILSYLAFVPAPALDRAALLGRRLLRPRAAAARLRLVYDQGCPGCRRTSLWVALLDAFHAVELVPLAEPARWKAHAPGLTKAKVEEGPWVVLDGGRPVAGFEAIVALGERVPALAPLRLARRLPGARALAGWLHAQVARACPAEAARATRR